MPTSVQSGVEYCIAFREYAESVLVTWEYTTDVFDVLERWRQTPSGKATVLWGPPQCFEEVAGGDDLGGYESRQEGEKAGRSTEYCKRCS